MSLWTPHQPPRGPEQLTGRVEAAFATSGPVDEVKDRLDEPGTALSGGQQQRLCIAARSPTSRSVLLLDEPCSALDRSRHSGWKSCW